MLRTPDSVHFGPYYRPGPKPAEISTQPYQSSCTESRPCFSASASELMFQILSVAPLLFIIIFFAVRESHRTDGTKDTVFRDADTGITLSYVSNSGVCEQTPGVGQYSGYADFGNNNVSRPLICLADLADAFHFSSLYSGGSSRPAIILRQRPWPSGLTVVPVAAA